MSTAYYEGTVDRDGIRVSVNIAIEDDAAYDDQDENTEAAAHAATRTFRRVAESVERARILENEEPFS